MSLYDNEENAVVNNEGGVSETPSNLVAPSDNEEKLSPNPAGFGFTKQLIVDELPNSGQLVNTLYLLTVKNDGVLVGYRLYKWTPSDGFALIGPTPNVKLEKGTQEQKAVEVNAPKEAPEKVFNGLVAFNKEPLIKGLPLSEYLDKHGAVTEEELQVAIASINQFEGKINYTYGEIDGANHYYINNSALPLKSGNYKLVRFTTQVNGLACINYSDAGGPKTWKIIACFEGKIFKKEVSGTDRCVFNDEDEVLGFDGNVKVTYVAPNYVIDDDDLPSNSGLYRLVNDGKTCGVIALLITHNPDVCYFSGNFNDLIFKGYQSAGDINIYNYSIEKMVQANPTLAGTEDALTGLQVGNTKYKVSGGTKLYSHELRFGPGYPQYNVTIISCSPNVGNTNDDLIDICKKVPFVRQIATIDTSALKIYDILTPGGLTIFQIDEYTVSPTNATITKTTVLTTNNLSNFSYFNHTVTEL